MKSIAVGAKAAALPVKRYTSGGKIDIRPQGGSNAMRNFFIGTAVLAVLSLWILEIDWLRILSRSGEIGVIFVKMAYFDFKGIDFTLLSFVETFSIMVLSTLYSIGFGIIFGLLAAENIVGSRGVSMTVKAVSAFLRAVPTPVWVLLTLVCFGFGPVAGIIGLAVHTTAFFTRAFAQAFEDVPAEVTEALAALGANRLQVIFCAVLPTAMTQLIAWLALRFEINFAECTILGMVGAGGIGFAISASIQNYAYGEAGAAIFLVFLFAFCMERGFIYLKKKIK